MKKKLRFFRQERHEFTGIIILCLLFCTFTTTSAQLFTANAFSYHESEKEPATQDDKNSTSLQSALKEFEKRFDIKITYQSNVVEDKFLPKEEVDHVLSIPKQDIETSLHHLMKSSFGLNFKKYKDNYYILINSHKLPQKLEKQPLEHRKGNLLPIESNRLYASRMSGIMTRKTWQITITGNVTDVESNESLPGVNVLVKNTTMGTVTDIDGNYTLDVPDDAEILVFSSVGYTTQEVEINGRTEIDVAMTPDVQSLEEVVVVGYGTVKKSDLTGSVSRIEASKISKTPMPNVDQALQGQASGVFVTSVNGSPGAQSTIRIRGGKSINAGNEPLYVIDGFISDPSIVTALNPGDVASIDVLKDASAAAIYGARGSNGVILITTKRGVEGQTEVTFSTSYGVQQIARRVEMLNAQEYIDFANQGEVFLGNPPAFSEEDRQRIGEGTDWQDVLSRTAPMYRAQLSVSGGDQKTKFYLSGNYFNQDGILVGNNYQRGVLRLNLDHKFNEYFEIGTNLNLSSIKDIPANFSWENLLESQPTLPVRQPDGSYTITQDITGRDFNNPVARNEFIHNERLQNQILSNTYVQFNLSENLHWRSTFGLNRSDGRQEQFTSSQLPLRLNRGLPGSGSVNTNTHTSILTENTLTYDLELNENHRFNFLGGITAQREQRDANITSSSNTLTDLLSVYGLSLSSPEFTNVNVTYNAFSLLSFIGRVNYVLHDKYLFTLTARQDGSSKFGINNRYAFFPAVAFGWRLSDEDFIKNLNVFDLLKLRLSYGKSGNSNGIGAFQRYQAMGTVFGSLGRGVRDVGVINNTLANDDLKWETTSQYDLGLEAGFLEGRLNFEVDLYYSKTKDLLFTREIPSQSGFTNRLENIGSLENRGVDFSMNAVIMDKEDFGWDVGFNISTYKNKILDLGGENRINTHTGGNLVVGPTGQLIVGQPLGLFTGFETNGIYQTQEQVDQDSFTNGYAPGEFRFVDQNGDSTISVNDDLVIIGDSNPDFFGGLQNTFRYKNFQLSAFFQFSYGNDIYNLPKTTAIRPQEGNSYGIYRNTWTPENTNTNIPAAQALNAQSSNDFNIEDGSFLRLRTLELAYNLSAENTRLPFKSSRIYLSGTNIFQLISNEFTGDDPETNNFGTNERLRGYYDFGYPYARTLMVGLEIKF